MRALMALFLAACRSFSVNESSDRVQFWKKSWGVGLGILVTLSAACSGATDGAADETTVPPVSTSTAIQSTTTTTSTATTVPTTTTTEPRAATGVIVSAGGVLGWYEGGGWRSADVPAAVPDTDGRTFRLVGPSGEIGTAVASAVRTGCEIIEEHVDLDLEPNPYEGFDPFSSKPIGIDADWNLVPYPVSELPLDSAVYADIVSDHLASRGFVEVDPEIVQLYRVDLEGDGADEVVIVADNHGGAFFQQGVYSVVLVRRVIEEEVQTAVLHESIVPDDLEADEFAFSVVARLAAIADLDDDGAMEIVLDSAYYEGAGTEVWDYVDDDLGFVSALLTGCGA